MLLAGYLLFLAWLALRPVSVVWVPPANLQPLASIREDLDCGTRAAVTGIGSGLARLAPLGVLLPLAAWRPVASRLISWIRTVFAAVVFSLTTELLQSGVPGQVANVDTVLLNTVGVALVHLLCYPSVRCWMHRRAAPPGSAAAPHRTAGRAAVLPEEDAAGRPSRSPYRVGISR